MDSTRTEEEQEEREATREIRSPCGTDTKWACRAGLFGSASRTRERTSYNLGGGRRTTS